MASINTPHLTGHGNINGEQKMQTLMTETQPNNIFKIKIEQPYSIVDPQR